MFKLLEHFVGRILQAGSEYGNPHLQPSALPSLFFRVNVLLFEPVQPLPNPIQLLVDVLSDRPQAEGRTTSKTSGRLRCSEESEVVSAGGQRGAIRIGQIGVQEKSSDVLLAQPPDSKLLPFVVIHAVHADERAEKCAQNIVACDTVENLLQIGAGVDEGMERIAPAATAGVPATGPNRGDAVGGVEQIERIPREVPDLESAVGVSYRRHP